MIVLGIGLILMLAAIITIIVLAGNSGGLDDQCTDNDDCGGNRVCDISEFKCKTQQGGKCKADEECGAGNVCTKKKCVRVTSGPISRI